MLTTPRLVPLAIALALGSVQGTCSAQIGSIPFSTESGRSTITPQFGEFTPLGYQGSIYRGGRAPVTSRTAINVYDAETGEYQRSILPPPELDGGDASLGTTMVIEGGTIAALGFAPSRSFAAILLFDASTGDLVRRIDIPEQTPFGPIGLRAGNTLQMSPSLIAVAGTVPIRGAGGRNYWKYVNVFDRHTGAFRYRIDEGTPQQAVTEFASLSITDELLAIGFDNIQFTQRGEVRLFEAATGREILRHESPAGLPGFGRSADLIGDSLYSRADLQDGNQLLYRYHPATNPNPDEIALPTGSAEQYGNYESRTVPFGDYIAIGRATLGDVPARRYAFITVIDPRSRTTVRILRGLADPENNFSNAIQADGGRLYARPTNRTDRHYFFDLDDICFADIGEPYGVLDFFDLGIYFTNFAQNNPTSDIAPPFGSLNFFDIAEYITLFNAGCP